MTNEFIKEILTLNPQLILTGSRVLSQLQIIDRECGDFDFICPIDEQVEEFSLINIPTNYKIIEVIEGGYTKNECLQSNKFKHDLYKLSNKVGVEIEYFNLCIFHRKFEIKYETTLKLDFNYKLSKPYESGRYLIDRENLEVTCERPELIIIEKFKIKNLFNNKDKFKHVEDIQNYFKFGYKKDDFFIEGMYSLIENLQLQIGILQTTNNINDILT